MVMEKVIDGNGLYLTMAALFTTACVISSQVGTPTLLNCLISIAICPAPVPSSTACMSHRLVLDSDDCFHHSSGVPSPSSLSSASTLTRV